MKKQYLSLLLLGISLCLTTGLIAQNIQTRPIDAQVNAAKTQGLFKESYTPFEMESASARRVADEAVSDATYLQMQAGQTRRIFKEHPAALTLSVPQSSGSLLELELVAQSPFAPGFFVGTSASNNAPVSYTPGVYYRGTIKGMPGSTVAVSVFEDEIIGTAVTTDKGTLVLGRLEAQGNETGYILYSDRNLREKSPFVCGAEEPLGYTEQIRESLETAAKPTVDKCVRVYIEGDYALHQNKGGVTGATNYVTAIFNNLAVLYANEQITTLISQVFIWTSQDSYPSAANVNVLNAFRSARPSFNGDIAHLVSLRTSPSGGIAWVNTLCSSYKYAYSHIAPSYSTVPTFSWSVEVMTHEMGHNLGSPHTQSCSWTGGALDNCVATEGGCAPGPAPTNGGTIMSYCHLTSYGINFNNGFGTQPGNLIRSRVTAASCLTTCNPQPPTGCTLNSATLTIVLDNYPEETSWNIKNSANQVVASGGTYGSSPDGSTITVPLCLANGCYTLTMLDAYGDGICCAYGNGSYSLKNNANNAILASGGQFGSQEVKSFCFNAGTPPQVGGLDATGAMQAEGFRVYPNPATDVLHINWLGEKGGTANIVLTDLAGRKLVSHTVSNNQGKNSFDMPLQQLPAGMYLLKLDAGGTSFQQKVMIR